MAFDPSSAQLEGFDPSSAKPMSEETRPERLTRIATKPVLPQDVPATDPSLADSAPVQPARPKTGSVMDSYAPDPAAANESMGGGSPIRADAARIAEAQIISGQMPEPGSWKEALVPRALEKRASFDPNSATPLLESITKLAKIPPEGSSFEMQKEFNREYLRQNSAAVVDYLQRDKNLAPEDARAEYDKMLKHGVVPRARVENARGEASYGDVLAVGAKRAWLEFGRASAGMGQWAGEVFGAPGIEKFYGDLASGDEKRIARAASGVVGKIPEEGFKALLAENAPSIIGQLPAALAAGLAAGISKNPAPIIEMFTTLTLSQMGAQKFGTSYLEGKAAGLSLGDNTVQSIVKTVSEVLPEKLSLEAFFKIVGARGVREMGLAFLRQQTMEHTTEQITTALDALTDKAYATPGMTVGDYLKQVADTFKGTALQAPLLGAAGATGNVVGKAATTPWTQAGRFGRDLGQLVDGASFDPAAMDWVVRESFDPEAATLASRGITPISEFPGIQNVSNRNAPAPAATPETGPQDGPGNAAGDAGDGVSGGTQRGGGVGAPSGTSLEGGQYAEAAGRGDAAGAVEGDALDQEILALEQRALDPATYTPQVSATEEIPVAVPGVRPYTREDLANVHAVAQAELGDRYSPSDIKLVRPEALPDTLSPGQQGPRLTRSAAAFMGAIAEAGGRQVVFFDSPTRRVASGGAYVTGNQNAIYLNVRGEINAATEAFHEAAHMLQDSDPGAYAELVASLDAATQDGRTVLDTSDGALLNFAWEYYGVRPDEVGGDLNQMLDRVGTTRNRLKDEMVADAVGVATRQKEFWPKLFMELGRRDIGALRKIHRVLRAVSAEVKRALTKGPTFSQIQRYINDMDALVSASSKALAKLATTPAAGKGVSGAHKNVVYSPDRIGPFASRGSAETTARWNATRNQFYDIVNTDSGIFLVKRGQNESGRSAEEPITGAGPGRVDQGKPAAATQPGSQVARSGGSSVPGSTGGGRGPGSDLRVSVRPEEAPSFGEPGKPGAVKVFGVHYSRGERSTLSGSYYGKGLRGAEARRLEGAPAELRNRAYFYIDEGSGTEAESGVGAFPHAVNLDGIYDVVADPEGLWAGQKDANSREMAVLEAGYTGYYHPGIFGSQGVAVVLNPKTEIPVLYAGATGSRTVPVKEVKPSAKRTIEKENKVSVVVGGKPGEFGWNLAARVAAARIDAKEREAKLAPAVARPPFLAPVHEKPNFAQMGAAVRKVLSAKGARDVIKEITGAEVSSVEQVLGSWEGKAEPSFVLSGSITFEQAQDVGNLLGVLFSQDATVVTQPWHGESDDQIPAVYIGQNKPMSPDQIAQVVATAKKEGIDFSTTTDGHGVKFLHFGDAAEYDILRGKIAKVAEAASLPDIKSYYVRSSLNENQDYLSGRVGRLFQGEGDPTRTPGRSDLFRRAVDHVLVPYAKAAGAQGYRFDPALFGERFGLTQDQTDYVRAALRPKNGKAISSVPIASGAEVLDPPRNNVRSKEPGVTKNDLLWALQNRVAQAGLISPTDYSEEAKRILAQAIADEVKWNVEQPGGKSAVGWYDAALHKAKSIYEEVFSELRNNPEQEMVFDAVLGITSQGNNVHSNAVFAGRIYHLMTREGMSIPEVAQVLRGTFGKQTVAIEQNLAKLDTLLRAMGLAKARAFFNTSTTVEGLRATIRNDLALRTLDGKPLVVSGVGPQKVTGWAVFGPKIGSFINNLHGDYSTLTADLWFSRTWNRLLGHAFLYNPDLATAQYVSLYRAMLQEVETGEGRDVVGLRPQDIEDLADSPEAMLTFARDTDIRREAEFKTLRKEAVTPLRQAATNLIRNTGDTVETPRSDSERYFQQQVVEEAQKELKGKAGIDISVADIQAVLWYHEKKLFSKYGVGDSKAEAADYADAARRFVTRFREGDLFYVEKPKPRYIIGTKGDYLNQGKVSLSRSRLGFFSPLSEAVAKARIEIQPATQWVLWLHSNAAKLGIKADEMKWSGVLDWLDTKGREKLTRDDVSRFLAEGGVKVSEVKYDEDPEAEVEDGYGASGRETSYSGYAMPGGMNYREVLLTYPQVTPTFDVYQTTRFSVFESSKSSKYHLVMGLNPQGFATREDAKKALEDLAAEDPSVSIKDAHIVDRGPSMERIGEGFESKAVAEDLIARNPGSYLRPGKPSAKVLFKSDHWKDPNVLAHLRLAEHIGPSGERVLFVEEVQSDWGQHVAKHGFDSPAVGQAPFISSTQGWTALALKRAIAIAVNERFDKVAFINGAQSAERYDLSEKVDRIEYVKTGPGEWSFGARNKKGEEILSRAGLSRGDLEAYLGKSIAEKITDDGGSREPGEPEGYGVVSGGDLKVGGEGMVAYYDKILPQILSGILKKAGSRLSSMTLEFHGVDSEGKAKVTSGKQLAFDVTPEMRQAVGQQGLPLFSPARARVTKAVQPTFSVEEPGRWDNIVYELQDKLVDVKRVREAIKAQGRAVKDQFDPYLAEETYHGRAAWRGQVFLDSEVAPLMTAMKSYAISIQGLEEYLHARHAQERNAAMAAINPGMANDALSGMSDADAQAVLARINASPKAPAFKALAARVDAITEGTRNLLVASGLETQATINDWRGAYKHYVPLQRDMGDADPATGNGTGQGFSVSGAASRRATGSNRPVEHILSNLVMQRERAITRAEKNRVAKALYGMVLENPAQGFWGAIHPGMSLAQVQAELQSLGVDPALSQALLAVPVTRTVNPSTGLVEERVNPLYKRMENVVLVRINGMDRAIVMSPSSARAMRLAESFKNLDVNTLHGVLTRIGAVTRYISAINTQYNPVFGFTNFARDIQGAAINLSSTPLAGKQLGLLLRALPAMRRIWVSERSGNIDPGYREFMEEGGQTGYKDMFAGPEDRAAALQAMIDPRWWEKAKPLNYVLSLLSDYNTAIENSVRLAAYQEARKAGMSKVQAASLAKNLTVNFNRKGRSGREANSLYAFFNAAVQGTARIGESMAGPAGRRILAAGVSLGVLQAVVGIAALGDGWDDLPDFEKDRNLIFPIPGAQKYAKVPMPLGLHVIPSLARKIVEVAYFKGRTGERVASMLSLVLDAFNPLGSGSFLDMALPSFLDPVAQLYANTDPFGRPIYKEDRSSLAPTPGFSRVKDTASAPARALAKAANSVTGGDEYEPGAWSPTPDQIDFVFGQITGGLGREVNKAFQAMTSSKDLPPHKIPLVGRFYGALDSSTGTKARYFRDLKELSSYELGVKGRAKDGKDVEAYLEANPKARLFAMGDATALAISKLEKYKRGLQDKEEVKAVDDQILGLMRSLSEAMALEDQATVK